MIWYSDDDVLFTDELQFQQTDGYLREDQLTLKGKTVLGTNVRINDTKSGSFLN